MPVQPLFLPVMIVAPSNPMLIALVTSLIDFAITHTHSIHSLFICNKMSARLNDLDIHNKVFMVGYSCRQMEIPSLSFLGQCPQSAIQDSISVAMYRKLWKQLFAVEVRDLGHWLLSKSYLTNQTWTGGPSPRPAIEWLCPAGWYSSPDFVLSLFAEQDIEVEFVALIVEMKIMRQGFVLLQWK